MVIRERVPAGPRGLVGAAAEDAAAAHLAAEGWTIIARNLRVGQDEVDIVALEPGRRPMLVIVEVRSRSSPGFGSALESVDGRKVARLYRAALALRREGYPGFDPGRSMLPGWRVDLLAMKAVRPSAWTVETHLRGLAPP